jgi:hypothetical protein
MSVDSRGEDAGDVCCSSPYPHFLALRYVEAPRGRWLVDTPHEMPEEPTTSSLAVLAQARG